MKTIIDKELDILSRSGNLRTLRSTDTLSLIDFSSNDYLGINASGNLQKEFMSLEKNRNIPMASSAARLLGRTQTEYLLLENDLENAYGRSALLLNSGYHANTGIIPALADSHSIIIADKLVHASIIDGIRLAKCDFERFRHNDYNHAQKLVAKARTNGKRIILIAESVYSMDGDCADIEALCSIKDGNDDLTLYVDEAHAVGVMGEHGLGLAAKYEDVDVIIGTMGKALASNGAFAIVSEKMKQFLINKSRSFIFSTALSPFQTAWSRFVFNKSLQMDIERSNLQKLEVRLRSILDSNHDGHIQPLILGSPDKALSVSASLRKNGIEALAIRVPTVPPGTDRIRFSLNASLTSEHLDKLERALKLI